MRSPAETAAILKDVLEVRGDQAWYAPLEEREFLARFERLFFRSNLRICLDEVLAPFVVRSVLSSPLFGYNSRRAPSHPQPPSSTCWSTRPGSSPGPSRPRWRRLSLRCNCDWCPRRWFDAANQRENNMVLEATSQDWDAGWDSMGVGATGV